LGTYLSGAHQGNANDNSKSQLAIEFAHRTAEETPDIWIFWIHAGTQARVEEGFRTIADAVKLPGRSQLKANIPQLVCGWLSNKRNGRWTIILDSADDRDVFFATNDGREGKQLADYLPQSQNGSLVVTTRSRDLAYRLTGSYKNIIEVGPMVLNDALHLLEKKLDHLSDVHAAQNLVQALNLVPLAINQAAAYIKARSPRSSVEKYLADFCKSERKRVKLLEHDAGDLRRDGGASNAILITWQMTFEHVCSKRPSAADLLSLMSFFDRQGIALSLLRPINPKAVMQDSGSDSNDSDDSTNNGFEDDEAILREFCLVAINDDKSMLEMHGLVQLSMRKWLEASGLQEKFKNQFVEHMTVAFPTGDYGNWAKCRQLFAHVEVAAEYKLGKEKIEEWASLMYNGSWYAQSQGRYKVAEQMANKALRSYKNFFGEDNSKTLASKAILAQSYGSQGQWKEAELLEVQVMDTRKRVLGEEHPDTLTSINNLASTYYNQGRWKEAELLEVQVMETRKRVLSEEHPDTLTSIANLASTYWNQGRWKEAELMDVQVMETRKRVLDEEHPDTLTSIANLASTYCSQGRWKEAELLHVQVMKTRKRVLGEEHPDTLTSIANLASTYYNQGRWKEAELLQVQVMETRKRVLGEEHPDTLISMSSLAFTWKDQGRLADALALMKGCAQA
jgi:tetratricopeptide (TPR) repeat protein